MIDRSRRHVLLHPAFLLAGLGLAGTLVYTQEGITLWAVLVLGGTLTGPLLVLGTVFMLRSRTLLSNSLYRICYTCPHCSQTGLPAFRCPGCGTGHTDLKPSVHGVFFAHCGTPRCGRRLPTINYFGRNALSKVCPNHKCGKELTHPSLGQVPEFRIAIVGATSSGKTNLMITAVWQFETVFAEANGFKVKFADEEEERGYRLMVERLEKGLVPDATMPIPIPKAFTLSITDEEEEQQSCLLYLYDAAGEDFQDPQALGGHPLHHYDALMFVIDPFNEEGTRRGALDPLDPIELAQAGSKGTEAYTIAAALLAALAQQLGTAPVGVHRIPVAVVVTKLDVCKVGQRWGIGKRDLKGKVASFTAAVNRAESDRDRVRALLQKIGLTNVMKLLEQNFYPTSYFGASPLGRSTDPFNSAAFQPRGVLGPLVWLCDQTTALGDTDMFDVLFINSHVALLRALGGRDGTVLRVGAWCGLAGLLLIVFLVYLNMPPLLFLLTAGITLVPLLLLDLYLVYVLIFKRYD